MQPPLTAFLIPAMALLISIGATMARAVDEKPQAAPAMEELGPGLYRIGKLRLNKMANTVTLPATLNMDEGNIEYLLVSPHGSTHESLLVSDVQPGDLHFAMLLLGAKGAGITTPAPDQAAPPQIDAEYLKRAPKLKGDPISITAKWTLNGVEKSARIEDWLLNTESKKTLQRGPWIYTGSLFSEGAFLAQTQGCIASVVTNPSALINNPRKGNDNDQVWSPNKKVLPPTSTPVELTIKLEEVASQ